MRITLETALSEIADRATGMCNLLAYLTLPSHVFVDAYQLQDKLFLKSKNLQTVHSIGGETDLEAPEWISQRWGSSMLIELARPTGKSDDAWHIDIPLHLRYMPPNDAGKVNGDVPWPVVFWACGAEEGTKMNVNPFDRVNLGYDGLFGPRTMFYHLKPQANASQGRQLIETLDIPVLDLQASAYVEIGTILAILLGFGWLVWQLFRALRGSNSVPGSRPVESKKKQ